MKDAEADLARNVGYHKRDEASERDGDMIDLDYGNIIIRFTNGNVVRITTSEWGDISKVDPSYILEVK